MPPDSIFGLASDQPAQPTPDQSKQATQDYIVQRLTEGQAAVKQVYTDLMQAVWRNPRGLTPRQVLAKLDTRAMSLMQAAEATRQYLESLNPGSTADLPAPPQGWTLAPELGPDQQPTGRIVVTEPA
jgi:hypothetical protein